MSFTFVPNLDEADALGIAIAARIDGLAWARGQTLKASYSGFADSEDVQEEPSAVVMPIEGVFEASGMTPHVLDETREEKAGPGQILWQDCEYVATVEIEIWGSNPVMRSLVKRAVREVFQGTDERGYGIDLDVPDYFGGAVKAYVAPERNDNKDSEEEARRRHRVGHVFLSVRLPVLRLANMVDLLPQFKLTVMEQGE